MLYFGGFLLQGQNSISLFQMVGGWPPFRYRDTMAGFGWICPKSPKLKFWVFKYLTRQNGRRHLEASYTRPKSIWFCVCMPKDIHEIWAKWIILLIFMNSIIKPWQKNRPSTLIRTDSDPKPAIYYLSKSGQLSCIVVHL